MTVFGKEYKKLIVYPYTFLNTNRDKNEKDMII